MSNPDESEVARLRKMLEDMPTLARLLSDAALQAKYKNALELLTEIGFDAIMREIADTTIGEPAAANEGALICRALTEEQRTGFNKARRAIRNFLVLQTIEESVPTTPDYGSDDALRRYGYDPSTIREQD